MGNKKLYYWIEDVGNREMKWDNENLHWKQVSGCPRLHLSSHPKTNYREYTYIDGARIPMPQGTYIRDIFIDDPITIPEWSTETFKGCEYINRIHFNVWEEIEETIGTKTVKKMSYKYIDFDSSTKYDYHGENLWVESSDTSEDE